MYVEISVSCCIVPIGGATINVFLHNPNNNNNLILLLLLFIYILKHKLCDELSFSFGLQINVMTKRLNLI